MADIVNISKETTNQSIPKRQRPIFNLKFLLVILCMSAPFFYSIAKYGYRSKPTVRVPNEIALFSASFSVDANRVLVGGNQPESWVLDTTTGKIIRRFTNSRRGVGSVTLSLDGKKALIGEIEGSVFLRDVDEKSGEPPTTFNTPAVEIGHRKSPEYNARYQAILSPDGLWAAIKNMYGDARLWNTQTGDSVRLFESEDTLDGIRCLAFSPDGKKIAIGKRMGGEARVYLVDTGEKIGAVINPSRCQVIAFTPDGSRMITGGGEDNAVHVWDAHTFEEIKTISHTSSVTSFAVSSDGSTLAVGGFDGCITVWNLNAGQVMHQFLLEKESIRAMQFIPKTTRFRSIDASGRLQELDTIQGRLRFSDGFQREKNGEIVLLPLYDPEKLQQKINEQAAAILDKRIVGTLSVENARIDDVLAMLRERWGLSYQLDESVVLTWTHNRSSSVLPILEWVIERSKLDLLVRKDGTLHIGKPETLAKMAQPGDTRDLSCFADVFIPAPDNTQFKFMYIKDLIEQLQARQAFPCVVEDDLYPLITLQRKNPTCKECLVLILYPYGLDYSIENGQVLIATKTEMLRKKKAQSPIINRDASTLPAGFLTRLEGAFSVERKPLSEVMNGLREKTGLPYILNASPSAPVSCNLDSPTVDFVLDTILSPLGLGYVIQKDRVVFIDGWESLTRKTDILLTSSTLTSLLLNYHSQFKTSVLVYSARETVAGSSGTVEEINNRDRLKELHQRLDELNTAPLSEELRQNGIETVSKQIKAASDALNGCIRDATHFYSVHGRLRKGEWVLTSDPFQHYSCLFDGNQFFDESPNLPMIIPTGLAPASIESPYRFGADLDWFIKQGAFIHDVDNQTRKVTLFSSNDPQGDTQYVFTLLDGNNAYWKECVTYWRGKPDKRISCEDFKKFGGMLIPQIVKIDIRTVKSDLRLVEAKVNQPDFPPGYFSPPEP